MAGDSCSSPVVTATAVTTTASFVSPRTPTSTPPPTTSRCFVRPLLVQRLHSRSDGPQQQQQQSNCASNLSLANLCESEREGAGGVEILLAKQHRPMRAIASSRYPGTAAGQQERRQRQEDAAETAMDGDAAVEKLASVAAKENDGAGHSSSSTTATITGGTAGGARCITIQPRSDHHTAAAPNGASRGQEDKRQVATCSIPINSACPCGNALVAPSPASYPSNLSASTARSSSASSSFYNAPASGPRAAGAGKGHAAVASLSPPALPDGAPTCNGDGNPSGSSTEAKVVPLLLRTWLSAHTIGEELGSPATSRSTPQNLVSGPSLTMPQAPLATLPPSGATSMGSVTPLSSNRSSTHPSFMRPPSVAYAGGEQGSIKVPGGLRQISGGGKSKGSPTDGIAHAVNGRVLCSPHGARRPDRGARRTTFQRSTSNLSLPETCSSGGAPPPSDLGEWPSGAAVRKSTASARPPPSSMPKEMHSFILSQYRTFQRDVLSLPPPPQSVDADATLVDFQHVKRATCSKHSKAAKKVLKAQEEVRLRALQQQHHDMEVIRNGGREHVGQNMKSSVVLAGSLSKLRARTRSSLGISGATALGASPATSLIIGSPEECSVTALYPGDGSGSATPEKHDAAQSQTPEPEREAWHASKAFMASNAPADAQRHGRQSRSVNKNRMKGEEIVVAIALDSEDEEDVDASTTSNAETWRRSRVDQPHRSAHVSPTGLRTLSSDTAAKCAGERLVSQPQRRRGAAASKGCAERRAHSSSSSSNNEEGGFPCNQQRGSRVRGASSPSSALPPGLCSPSVASRSGSQASLSTHALDSSHHHSNATMALLAHSSSESDDEEDAAEACCHCCPCKRPKNFFALCRTSSQSAASLVWRGEKRNVAASAIQEEKPSSTAISCTNPDGSQFVVEDLEDSDEDEPTLSMQSFRRANIQRIR
ncbi:hypothetical protein LMJF_34_0450 [Leishmania major strain Friedlin]|uniref:Uncharacterized protein n=1 Tax=Leishmania major TaxID=5664 RepID=Q4Q3G3_LEIMA|nr:hypothetical protein LMJF_34_0450 [Leishmania major strain Friedlin]CAG9581792.1 hypothetical_protein [Leishmania major strain Friedlin]CAJ07746.1 hypothetical protein LMJF_34_0450 [Leishmania major strain Friedlin]|eukprot:XP_001686135.1 hypothetical protein LMJF_34_0450 [Leishmania major strain Friedlin]